jgi:serine/threonine-protein kinase RsbW
MSERGSARALAGVDVFGRPPKTRFTRTLPRRPESARAARRLVTAALRQWDLAEVQDAAHLVVTEFVSNAAKHATRDMVLVSVTRRGDRLVRIAVVDLSDTLPVLRCVGPDAVDGRGLAIVAQVSHDRWGAEPMRWGCRRGKRVWADLEVPL